MRPEPSASYRGRFAPTPSGPLHFGSIIAATGSYLDALTHAGEWHVRIDDLDPPRVAPGAADAILRTLTSLGFEWSGPVVRQSTRRACYEDALATLRTRVRVYPCTCTRVEIARAGLAGIEGPRYPGTCRAGPAHPYRPPAFRVEASDSPIGFTDLLQGPQVQTLATATGDFVLRRADGVVAYHLACIVDDWQSGFTHVVRGADLLDSVGRQLFLLRLLGGPEPQYLHLPVAVDASGQKLSKQTLAPAVAEGDASALERALAFLDHPPPAELRGAGPAVLWAWARTVWRRDRLPATRTRALTSRSE